MKIFQRYKSNFRWQVRMILFGLLYIMTLGAEFDRQDLQSKEGCYHVSPVNRRYASNRDTIRARSSKKVL